MGQVPHASDASDPLVQLNNLFHSQYTASGVAVRPPVYIIIEVCTVLVEELGRVSSLCVCVRVLV